MPRGYVGRVLTTMRTRSRALAGRYAGEHHRPLPGYIALAGGYTALAATALAVARGRADRALGRPGWGDLALITVSTYRLSRILTKDAISSPLRAPLTTFTGPGLPGEVNEEVAPEVEGRPVLHAVAELATCPFCAGQWVATSLVAGQVIAPGVTRLVTSVLTAAAGAEALHYVHAALHRLEAPPER
jgi:hypothetical protein